MITQKTHECVRSFPSPRPALVSILSAVLLILSVQTVAAQSLPADSVSANGTPPRWGSRSCTATIPELSDGSISNPGICLLGPVDPNYRITFTFSPPNDLFMTGINIWANDGSNMNDHELRQLDVEVDYFDPATNSTQTLVLDDVNIGDTTTFNDPKFVSFGGSGLYRVSEVRLDNFVGRTPTQQATFREVQGVFAILPVAPEISIASSEAGAIPDGGTDTQGTESTGAAKTVTYTITNSGTDTLTLGTPTVSGETNLSGAVSVGAPGATSLAPGETTTFDVTYTPAAGGAFGFDIDVPNNDPDESPYDIAVSGTANDAPSVTLTSTASPPGGPFNVTATFSEPVNDMTLSDFDVTNGVASGFANPSPGIYTVVVTATDPSSPVEVTVPAAAVTDTDGDPNSMSNTLTFVVVSAPSPTDLTAIERIIAEETVRDMRDSIAFNQRALRTARARHAQFLSCHSPNVRDRDDTGHFTEDLDGCAAVRGLSVEPVFDGKFTATEKSVSGNGSFFAQTSSADGTRRRLALGELSFTRFEDGDSRASLNGRVAWERLMGEDMLRGLFIGAHARRSDIDDVFTGTRSGFGLNAGAYFVDRIDASLFWDGFVSLGVGRSDLDLGNGTLDVDGDYTTASLQLGVAVTGERAFERFTLYPELSFAYGITSVGDADLVSTSGTGTTTDTLSVGSVALAVLRFRPEFVLSGEADRFGIVRHSFSVAPSALCETVRTDATETDCGAGLELGWTSRSENGLSEISARVSREVVGGAARDQVSILYERRF